MSACIMVIPILQTPVKEAGPHARGAYINASMRGTRGRVWIDRVFMV